MGITFYSVHSGKIPHAMKNETRRLLFHGLLVLWMFGLIVVDIASFPYYMDMKLRIERLEKMTGSVMIPTFYTNGTMQLKEYIAVYKMTMSTDRQGSSMYVPIYIPKEEIDKFLQYDSKTGYKRKSQS